jgi:ankyrin repeat protein
VVKYYIEAVQDEKVWNRASNTSDIANRGLTPLHRAVLNGEDDVAKFLLKHMSNKMP